MGEPRQQLENAQFTFNAEPAQRLDRVLRTRFPEVSWSSLRKAISSGKVALNGVTCRDPGSSIAGDVHVSIRMSAPKAQRKAAPDIPIQHVDNDIVVVEKPAGISSVPYDDSEFDTLMHRVRAQLHRLPTGPRTPLGVVQRLDKDTSGVLVFARNVRSKKHLQRQFRAHTVERRYVAVAHGDVETQTVESMLVKDRGDGLRGSTERSGVGRRAVTHIRRLQRLQGATLIECELETGRTHQIRIHLSEAGHPLLGERVYIRRYAFKPIECPRLMLHARELGFEHPRTERPLRFRFDPPPEFESMLATLRARA